MKTGVVQEKLKIGENGCYLVNQQGEAIHSIFCDLFHTFLNEGFLGSDQQIADFLQLEKLKDPDFSVADMVKDWRRQIGEGPDFYTKHKKPLRIGTVLTTPKNPLIPADMAVSTFPQLTSDRRLTGNVEILWVSDVTDPNMDLLLTEGRELSPHIHAAHKANWHANKHKSHGFVKGVNELKGSHKGKPCLIIGNGPSLEKQQDIVDALLEDKRDMCVIGANRALDYFDPQAIDYFAVLDYIDNSKWSERITRSIREKITALCWTNVHPWVNRAFKNIHWMSDQHRSSFLEEKEDVELAQRIGTVGCGPNVAHWMLSFAYRILEADPIIMIGVDHAYTFGNIHKSRPLTKKQMDLPNTCSALDFIFDVKNRVSFTDIRLKRQNRVLNGLAAWIASGGWPEGSRRRGRVINSSEYGCPMEFAEEIDLIDILRELNGPEYLLTKGE